MSRARRSAPAPDWLCDLSGKTARITSVGNQSLLVENHRGLLCFTDSRVRLSTACGEAEIIGSNLELRDVRRDTLVIHGRIRDVKLPDEGANADES